jgi:hypothetical protein
MLDAPTHFRRPPAVLASSTLRRRVGIWAAIAFLTMLILLSWAAPISKTLEPPVARSVVFLASDGEPFERRGP